MGTEPDQTWITATVPMRGRVSRYCTETASSTTRCCPWPPPGTIQKISRFPAYRHGALAAYYSWVTAQ